MLQPFSFLGLFVCVASAFSASGQNNPFTVYSSSSVTVPGVPVATVEDRFAPPVGYSRKPAAAGSFGAYLRSIALKPADAQVHLFDGRLKNNQGVHAAVIDMSVGTTDLQQCADAVMRLRAEFLFAADRKDEIAFNFTNGFKAPFSRWTKDERIRVQGNNCTWTHSGKVGATHADLMDYLHVIFTYAGTASLSKELVECAGTPVQPGDVFIQGGHPGHAVIVVDVASNTKGEQIFLLAQSYMPAQEIHVLKNLEDPGLSPWFKLNDGDELETPEWTFQWDQRKRWP
jgi:hypothetical protein